MIEMQMTEPPIGTFASVGIPRWVDHDLNWERIVEHANVDGFFDNVPYELKKDESFAVLLAEFRECFSERRIVLDHTFNMSVYHGIGVGYPESAALLFEMRAMILLLVSGQWAYAIPYMAHAYRYHKQCGNIRRARGLHRIIKASSLALLRVSCNNQTPLSVRCGVGAKKLYLTATGIISLWGTSLKRLCISFMVFGMLFSGLNWLSGILGGTFVVNGSSSPDGRALSACEATYYTIVSMTTLGFGDITPIGNWLRVLAMMQTLVGFVILGNLVAVFVDDNKID